MNKVCTILKHITLNYTQYFHRDRDISLKEFEDVSRLDDLNKGVRIYYNNDIVTSCYDSKRSENKHSYSN